MTDLEAGPCILYLPGAWKAPAEKQLRALRPLSGSFLPQHLSRSPAVLLEGGNASSHSEVGEP